MPNNVGLALGTMAGVFGQHFAQQKQQEHDDEQKRIQLVSGLVSSGLKDGSISNPNEAFQFLLDQVGGKGKGGKGKGGQKGELPGPLKMMLGATQQAAGQAQGAPGSDQTLGGQQRPSFQPQAPQAAAPHFLTGQERDQQATDSDINRAKRLQTEVTQPGEAYKAGLTRTEKAAEEQARLNLEKAKAPKGVTAGSFAQAYLSALSKFTEDNGREPTAQESIDIREKLRGADAEATRKPASTRSHLTGEALQAYDMNQMLAGIDPETGAKPENPEDAQRLMAAGQEMKRERAAKAQAATVRINMAGAAAADKAADAKEIAQGIINGDQPPDLSRLYGAASKVRAELERAGFPLQKAITDWAATQRYLSSINSTQQVRFRQSVDAMDGYLDSIDELAKKWKGGKFPVLNKASLALAKGGAQGPEAQQLATQLETQIADATADLAVIYRGGGSATSDALKLAAQNLQGNWTEAQLRSNIALVRKNMQIRKASMNPGAQGVNGPVAGANDAKTGGDAAAPSPSSVSPDVAGALKDKPGGRRYRVGGKIYEKLADGTIREGK